MKKYFQFKKEEKAVLAIGILMIAVVLTAGLLKQKFVKAEAYVPLKEEQQSVNAIAAKKETFIIEQNAKLSQKAETYVNADSDVLKKVKLDLSVLMLQHRVPIRLLHPYRRSVYPLQLRLWKTQNRLYRRHMRIFSLLLNPIPQCRRYVIMLVLLLQMHLETI